MIPALFCLGLSAVLSFYLLDSPQYHFDKGNLKKARYLFREIARINGVEHFDFKISEYVDESSASGDNSNN
jgi:hypothetical protein